MTWETTYRHCRWSDLIEVPSRFLVKDTAPYDGAGGVVGRSHGRDRSQSGTVCHIRQNPGRQHLGSGQRHLVAAVGAGVSRGRRESRLWGVAGHRAIPRERPVSVGGQL